MSTKYGLVRYLTTYVDTARFGIVGKVDSSIEVASEDVGRKTVYTVVSKLQGFLICLELGNDSDGPKDFLSYYLRVRLRVREDCWLNVVPLVADAFATSDNGSTFILAGFDVT